MSEEIIEFSNQIASRQMLEMSVSADQTLARIKAFQKVAQKSLVKGHDFVSIAGRQCLAKPGAEKIFMLLGVSCTFEILDRKDTPEVVEYMLRCRAVFNGEVVAEGLGSCNSQEKKYAKQSIPDLKNTILKMAEKRAKVDCALHIGALSDIFTQDLEDIDTREQENIKNQEEVAAAKPISAQQIKSIDSLFIKLSIDTPAARQEKLQTAFNKTAVEQLTRHEAELLINKMRSIADKQTEEEVVF